MFPVNRIRSQRVTVSQDHEPGRRQECTMKALSLLDWYRILRAHHEWTIFQSIRYALWLAS